MKYEALNLQQKPDRVTDLWSPWVSAEINEYQFKLVRVEGELVWHDHAETFIVLDGCPRIKFRDGEVTLNSGEMFVVPAGVEQRPCADSEVKMLPIEPRGIVNTGAAVGELTAPSDQWV